MKSKWVFVLGFGSALFLTCFVGMAVALFSKAASRSAPSLSALAGSKSDRREMAEEMMAPEAPPPPSAMPMVVEGKMAKRESAKVMKLMSANAAFGGAGAAALEDGAMQKEKSSAKGGPGNAPMELGEDSAAPAATRAWFPETFLFEPLVLTDSAGRATVPVKVPDRLTSWRVLALAHSRQGGQAGAVASFLGTLPTYVDPVVPGFLVAGDEIRLPVQLVNTTAAEVSSTLKLAVLNGVLSAAGGAVKIPAEGNSVQYVTLKTPRPGTTSFKATLGGTDAIERTIEVKPAGKLEVTSAGSTLAAPRTVDLSGPLDALEGSERIRLEVFPGALALVRSELSSAPGRGGVADDAYTLLLTGRAPSLLQALGIEPDMAAIRDLSVLATQRAIRHARAPEVTSAVLLAEAALAHGDNPILSRLGERLAAQVAAAQRPDGTCQGANGWTLQRLLVTTAGCVQAVRAAQSSPAQKQRATAVAIKAQGAFERNLARIDDGFTAAAILASGAVSGSVADALQEKVLKAISEGTDGAKLLSVGSGVVRSDAMVPSTAEATALALLALQRDPKQALVVADLGTWLLAHYSPVSGWGDGQANLAALRAVTSLFKTPVPAGVKILLERDGQPIVSGVLDAAHLHDVLVLEALVPGSTGSHSWGVRADPAVPGLGFSLTLFAHRPWRDELASGLEYTAKLPEKMEVGKTAELELTVAAPANTATRLRLALPAGVQSDTPSLDALVDAHLVNHFETEDGAITLHLNPGAAGATQTLKLKVVPTLAGILHPAATTLEPEGRPQLASSFKPAVWMVK